MHLGLFSCLTKLSAKRAELVQKFVPKSRDGIFRNKCTRSTPIGPKIDFLVRFILFECIWDRLVCLTKLWAKWAELVQKFVPQSRVGVFRNEHA